MTNAEFKAIADEYIKPLLFSHSWWSFFIGMGFGWFVLYGLVNVVIEPDKFSLSTIVPFVLAVVMLALHIARKYFISGLFHITVTGLDVAEECLKMQSKAEKTAQEFGGLCDSEMLSSINVITSEDEPAIKDKA